MLFFRKKRSITAVSSAVALFGISLFLLGVAFYFQDKLSTFRAFGLLGIFFINIFGSATLFLPAPALASVIAGGLVYPPLAVAYMAAFGASIGDMLGFLLGHSGKHVFIAKQDHKMYVFTTRIFKRYGAIAIFVFAFIPNPFFDFIGIIAGVCSYSPLRFFLLMFLGRFLRDIILAFAGSRL